MNSLRVSVLSPARGNGSGGEGAATRGPFKCKLYYYHANKILVSIPTRSPSALLQIKGLATEYTTVKWSIKILNYKLNENKLTKRTHLMKI